MGKGREIARRTDRALRRDHGQDAAVQHGQQQPHGGGLHARCPLRQAGQLQRHHQPHHPGRQRLADAGAMRPHDIDLKLRQPVDRDAYRGELAEAGVYAIDRVVAACCLQQQRMALFDARPAGPVQRQRSPGMHGAPERQPCLARVQQCDRHGISLCCPRGRQDMCGSAGMVRSPATHAARAD